MGKELVFQTLRHERADRVSRLPYAGVHAWEIKKVYCKRSID